MSNLSFERTMGVGPTPQPLAPTSKLNERETGIGPAFQPWEGCILPLYDSRKFWCGGEGRLRTTAILCPPLLKQNTLK